MTEFQALITGAVAGALMKEAAPSGPFLIDVFQPHDDEGNYKNEIHVRGRESEEWLKVTVETMTSEGQHLTLELEDETRAEGGMR